jgi:diguanylate cyclase (GGDEF)-like protein/PAS domain S-box-containing protein
MKSHLRPRTLAVIALVCGLAASLAAWFASGRLVERESRARFAAQAGLAGSLLERRIQRYTDLLYGVAALAYHDPTLSRAEYARYVSALELGRRFPGVHAVELIRRVPDEERDEYVQRVRADRSVSAAGYPAFDIRPSGRRDEYWVVDFVEPREGNESVFGLDMRTRMGAAAAAERARGSDEPAATGRYRLGQDVAASYGIVIYLPVYAAEAAPVADPRRRTLRGFVDVALRVDDMLADVLAEPLVGGLRLQIRDLGTVGSRESGLQDTVFYRSPEPREESGPFPWAEWRHDMRQAVAVAGRSWQLEFESPAELHPWLTRFPLLVLGAGLGMTLLIYTALTTVARARSAALRVADRATTELRRQLSFTQQLIEAMPNPVFFKDGEGRYLGCNRAFEDYLGVSRDLLIGKTVDDIAAREFADLSMRADQALLEQSGTQSYETSLLYARDGTRHDVLVNKATFYTPSGEVGGLVGVLVDITERKVLEAETRESHERLRAVIHASPLAIIARDVDGIIRMWNPAAERMFGWKEEEVLETNTSIVPQGLRPQAKDLRQRAQAGETIWLEETRRIRRDGSECDVSLSIAPIYGEGNVAIGTMVTLADISRRKLAEQALRESEEQLRLAMDAAQMGIWYWECESDRFVHSEGLSALFGGKATDPMSHYRVFQQRLHPEDRDLLDATMRHAVRRGVDFQVDYRVVWPSDGSTHWLTNRGQIHRDEKGRAKRVIGVAMDITDRKLAEQRIAHMAHHDALTGLPNRVLLRDRIQQAIAQAHRNAKELAVLFLDLDRFKTINDSLGHQLGDRLLQSVASRILVCVREGDTVARVGGDEFVIVIPGIESAADASSVASKILEVLATAFHLNGSDLHVSASIGISLYPSDGADAETLMRNADTAMYHAKDSGRGNFQFFTQHMNVAAQQRLTLENALRRALEAREFELHYQPLFDLATRTITGFEALLRWNAPGGEVASPGQFIAVAEESGLIVPIGEWALREALGQAKAWQSAGHPLTIAVNVSANQLARPNFTSRLKALLEETGVEPSLLELEVTEGVIVEGAGEAREAIDHVAALGVGIAIDDFGTGYSGLAYLKRLPIDTVKIDQSFVRDLTVDPDDAAIVTAIVAMAASLGVDVVAEGIETEEQLEQLKRLGCRRGQGYLLARPMNAAAITALLGAALEPA